MDEVIVVRGDRALRWIEVTPIFWVSQSVRGKLESEQSGFRHVDEIHLGSSDVLVSFGTIL